MNNKNNVQFKLLSKQVKIIDNLKQRLKKGQEVGL